jgi:hypothetical protein
MAHTVVVCLVSLWKRGRKVQHLVEHGRDSIIFEELFRVYDVLKDRQPVFFLFRGYWLVQKQEAMDASHRLKDVPILAEI